MKKKMIWKLTACFAVVLLLFTAVLGTVFVSMFRRHTIAINRQAMEERANSIAETLAGFYSGGTGLGRGGMGGYGAYLRFLDELALAEVWIVDAKLNLLTTGHGRQDTTYQDLPENAEQLVAQIFAGELIYSEEFSSVMDVPTLTVGAPVYLDGSVAGAVLVHSPVGGVEEAVRQGMLALAVGVVVALILSGIAAVVLSYYFTRPLQRMKIAALHMAEGDYSAKTQVRQSDEIGQLAQSIDLLSEHLLLAEQERLALDQLKQDFIANVSHELRTPVAVLRGSLEVLQDGTVSEPDEILDYYEQMLSESRHLERLVNDLLDLSRLQDIQFSLNMEEINLCDVVRDAARSIRRAALRKNITINTICTSEACMILGDYGRIRQMLLILLDNAVKFSTESGIIELGLVQREEQGHQIYVSDYGCGISDAELPLIFDRFQKVRNKQNLSGTGLGLPIAKQIAQRHGASIYAASGNGKTSFFILF